MYTLLPILSVILTCLDLVETGPSELQEPLSLTPFPPPKHRLRPLVEEDLDDFVTTYIDAFRPGPLWQYLFTFDEDMNATWHCLRDIIQEQWEEFQKLDDAFINVIAVPTDETDAYGRSERVVSLAVWNWERPEDEDTVLPFSQAHLRGGKEMCSDHLDINTTRAEDFSRQFEPAYDRYMGNLTEPQLYLGLLATHPDWDGNGFGAAQLAVGLVKAAFAMQPVTLVGTAAGWPLYDEVGFRSLGNITVEMLDGLGVIWQEYMRWDDDDDDE